MRAHLDVTLVLLATAAWLHAAWPEALAEPPPAPSSPTRAPASPCGLALTLEAALPAPSTRARPERAWLRNLEPFPLALDGFALTTARQRRPLPALTLAPGELVEVTPPRLRNRDGRLRLVDPCGIALAELAWDSAPHDTVVVPPWATASPAIPLTPSIPSIASISSRSWGPPGHPPPVGASEETFDARPHTGGWSPPTASAIVQPPMTASSAPPDVDRRRPEPTASTPTSRAHP